MINFADGNLYDPQETVWVENKLSAIIELNTHLFHAGESFVVGYKIKSTYRDANPRVDIMMAIGISEGMGPEHYRIVMDKGVLVVAEVLDRVPDVAYYAFNQRYLVRDTDKNLYLTRRYKEGNDVKIEKIPLLDRVIVQEASTGKMYICNPPEVIDFYDVTNKISFSEIEDLGGGDVKATLSSGGVTYDDLHFMSSEEKKYITSKLFDEKFKVNIEVKKYDYSGRVLPSDCVDPLLIKETIYYLEPTWDGETVELDTPPYGWNYDGRKYFKKVVGNLTSNSGITVCRYTVNGFTGKKTIDPVFTEIKKYLYIFYSPKPSSIIASDIITNPDRYLISSVTGSYEITPPRDYYTWFAIPQGIEIDSISQMGISYVKKGVTQINSVTENMINLGGYTLYRSLNPGNGLTQNVNIA